MIEYIKDDITNVTKGLVVHGCNCSGGFGSGVAGAIRKKWPVVFAAFANYPTGKDVLGHFVPVQVTDDLIVGNCYTQLRFGSDGKKYASLDAIKYALRQAYQFAEDNEITTLCLPKIGAGLGGLSWEDEVEPEVAALAYYFNSIDTKVYYID